MGGIGSGRKPKKVPTESAFCSENLPENITVQDILNRGRRIIFRSIYFMDEARVILNEAGIEKLYSLLEKLKNNKEFDQSNEDRSKIEQTDTLDSLLDGILHVE